MRATGPELSVIIPAHQAAGVLPAALQALERSDLARDRWELVVVDDASTDETAIIAAQHADLVVRLAGRPHGPAYARNRGFEVTRGELIVFLDADVCVHPDTLSRFAALFAGEPELSAAFGSYDAAPAHPGLVSQYRNLLHHYIHQRGAGEAETFWAGCGAIRRAAFADAGMYDEWHFPRPQIEDIELGQRVRDLGHRILLRPEIQVTHLKRWTLRGVLAGDLRNRGVPWMRLLIQRNETVSSGTLNLRLTEKVCTILTWSALLYFGVAAALGERHLAVGAALALGIVVAVNARLYAFFARTRGVAFALAAIPLHLLYYLNNGVAVLYGWTLHHVVGEPTPAPIVEAYAEVGVQMWPPVPNKLRSGAWAAE